MDSIVDNSIAATSREEHQYTSISKDKHNTGFNMEFIMEFIMESVPP